MNDYERVARVIEHLGANFREQPSLDALAARAGLSVSHFHRLFRRWAGTTPKSYLAHLSVMEARRLLREGNSVLDTALDLGLSGPGRLHDLCVKLEAASPGEIGSGGEGWKIRGGFCETPFGEALIAVGPRGVCQLAFVEGEGGRVQEWGALVAMWPKAEVLRDNEVAEATAGSIFSSEEGASPKEAIRLLVKGSAFQNKVWRALIEIPAGEVRSYGQIAAGIGAPQSARAVGNAIGRNSIGFLIPCHRVIHSSGAVGNYRWGTTRKRAILGWERSAIYGEEVVARS